MALPENISRHLLHVFLKSRNAIFTWLLFAVFVVAHAWNILHRINLLRLIFRLHFALHFAINMDDVDVKCDVLKLQKLLLCLFMQIKLAVLI